MNDKQMELRSFVNTGAVVAGTPELPTLTGENYHATSHIISASQLKVFHASPTVFELTYISKGMLQKETTDAMVFGQLAHEILLENRSLSWVAPVYPERVLTSDGKIGAKAKDWALDLEPGQTPVKQAMRDKLEAMLAAVEGHDVIELVANATAREKPFTWWDRESTIPCKCRPDFYYADDTEAICYDLKFVDNIYRFRRSAETLKYWLQDGHYSRGLSQCLNTKVSKFVFWAVETKLPYRVARFEYDEQSRENAWIETGETLCRLAECIKTQDWTDPITAKTNTLYFQSYESSPEVDWS